MPGTPLSARLRRCALAALTASVAACAAASPAHAAAGWFSGNAEYQVGAVGGFPGTSNITGNYAMYWTDRAGYPAIGDKYYMQLHTGVIGYACPYGITDLATELVLPEGTQLAIDLASANKNDRVRCFLIDSNGVEKEYTDAVWIAPWDSTLRGKYCDSTKVPARSTYGLHLGQRLLAQGTQFVVRVPVMSTKRLAGMGGAGDTTKMAGVLTSGVNTTAVPFQWVTVADRATTITYPAGATTNITNTTAKTNATLNSWYRKGNVYVDLGGATGDYTVTAGPFPIDGRYAQYSIGQEWAQLTPGTDHRWRVRFVDESGVTTSGAPQAFRTTGTAPAPGGGGGTPGPTPGTGGTGGTPTGPGTGGGGGGGGTPPGGGSGGDGTPGGQQPLAGDRPGGEQPRGDAPSGDAGQGAVAPIVAPRTGNPPVAPGPTTGVPAFRLAPGARLSALAKGVPVTVTCRAACSATATLRIDARTARRLGLGRKAVTIATGRASARSAGKAVVRLRAPRTVARKLRRARSAVRATLTVKLAGGGVATRSVTLRR